MRLTARRRSRHSSANSSKVKQIKQMLLLLGLFKQIKQMLLLLATFKQTRQMLRLLSKGKQTQANQAVHVLEHVHVHENVHEHENGEDSCRRLPGDKAAAAAAA